jgi:phosphoribosylformylglycinamidine (FGAM) synthase-like enzyme
MTIASDRGAAVNLPRGAAEWPTAALFGERTGRVLLAISPDDAPGVAEAAAHMGVPAERLGTAQGRELRIEPAGPPLRISVEALASAWETPF